MSKEDFQPERKWYKKEVLIKRKEGKELESINMWVNKNVCLLSLISLKVKIIKMYLEFKTYAEMKHDYSTRGRKGYKWNCAVVSFLSNNVSNNISICLIILILDKL